MYIILRRIPDIIKFTDNLLFIHNGFVPRFSRQCHWVYADLRLGCILTKPVCRMSLLISRSLKLTLQLFSMLSLDLICLNEPPRTSINICRGKKIDWPWLRPNELLLTSPAALCGLESLQIPFVSLAKNCSSVMHIK